jgi:hypothetical protein
LFDESAEGDTDGCAVDVYTPVLGDGAEEAENLGRVERVYLL